MGHIGIGLLVISGLYMITPYWKVLLSTPLLMIKLTLVLVLLVLITLITQSSKRAMKGDALAELKKMEKLGKMTLIVGVTIVILAVNIFH
jgi:uncharacterized membrane protein